MAGTMAYCVGMVAPYYNLALVIIVIILFLALFKKQGKNAYTKPWKFLFASVLVYVGEEVITVLDMAGIINVHNLVFPLLEMAIITLFIYVLLLQREIIRK